MPESVNCIGFCLFPLYIKVEEGNSLINKTFRIAKPTDDQAFKYIMSEANEGGRERVTDLLESILNIRIRKLTYLDSAINATRVGGKKGFLDLRVEVNDRIDIDVEMQVIGNEPGLERRLVYYLTKMIADKVSEGEKHIRTNDFKLIVITVGGWRKESKDYVQRFFLKAEDGTILSEAVECIIISLDKFEKRNIPYEKMNAMDKWFYFLLHCGENDENMVRLRRENKILKGAEAAMSGYNETIAMKHIAMEEDRREWEFGALKELLEYQTDHMEEIIAEEVNERVTEVAAEMATGMAAEMATGMAAEMATGMVTEKTAEIALDMLKEGIDSATVCRITRLSEEEIQKLVAKLKA